jgi:hypothetical protein
MSTVIYGPMDDDVGEQFVTYPARDFVTSVYRVVLRWAGNIARMNDARIEYRIQWETSWKMKNWMEHYDVNIYLSGLVS